GDPVAGIAVGDRLRYRCRARSWESFRSRSSRRRDGGTRRRVRAASGTSGRRRGVGRRRCGGGRNGGDGARSSRATLVPSATIPHRRTDHAVALVATITGVGRGTTCRGRPGRRVPAAATDMAGGSGPTGGSPRESAVPRRRPIGVAEIVVVARRGHSPPHQRCACPLRRCRVTDGVGTAVSGAGRGVVAGVV